MPGEDDRTDPMDIVIFKAGRMIGPLDRVSVSGMLARGEVSEHDLAQRGGVEVWVPLRQFFRRRCSPRGSDWRLMARASAV